MTTMPPEITYGHVTGRFIAAWTDGPDAGRLPDPRPLGGLTVKITPKVQARRLAGAAPVLVATMPVTCKVDADGRLIDEQGNPGVWLVTGVYGVSYAHPAVAIRAHDIEVTDAHTEDTPLDLVTAMPPGGPVLTASQYAELSARIDALGSGGGGTGGTGAVSSVNGQTGAVVLDAADVGALPDSTPIPAEPADLGAATAAQGAKADTAVQPDDVNDVIREGDSRLNDTRTPKAHTHTASEVSGLPDPQTLSLSGADLSLSGGGGTVTLPSGGGGGSGYTPTVGSTPGATVTPAPTNFTNTGADSWRQNRVYAHPVPIYPVGGSITVTHASVRINAAVAGASIRVGLYRSVANGDLDGTQLVTEVAIPAGAIGAIEAALAAPVTLAPGIYWQATCPQGGVPLFWQATYAGFAPSVSLASPGLPGARFRNGITGTLPTDSTAWAFAGEANAHACIGWRIA